MGVNIAGRSFLKLLDYTTEEIEYLLELSANFKSMKRAGVPHKYLEGKNIVLRRLPRVLAAPSKLVHLTLAWV